MYAKKLETQKFFILKTKTSQLTMIFHKLHCNAQKLGKFGRALNKW